MSATSSNLLPTVRDLEQRFQARFGDLRGHGWRIRMRHRFGYFDPEWIYEAVVDRLVDGQTRWLDVGGGRETFPHNRALSEELARRCARLVAVDPSENLAENALAHERVRSTIEEYRADRPFDLATLRMVAEHIEDPPSAVAALARLLKPGGTAVVYTPNRWSPASLAASLLPHRLHAPIAAVLWQTHDADVFPTVYRMNSRRRLRAVFEAGGFREAAFARLDSCTAMQRFRWSCLVELCAWRAFRAVRLTYPENNLLGVYHKT